MAVAQKRAPAADVVDGVHRFVALADPNALPPADDTDGVVMESYEYNDDSLPDPVVGEGKFIFPIINKFYSLLNIIIEFFSFLC